MLRRSYQHEGSIREGRERRGNRREKFLMETREKIKNKYTHIRVLHLRINVFIGSDVVKVTLTSHAYVESNVYIGIYIYMWTSMN